MIDNEKKNRARELSLSKSTVSKVRQILEKMNDDKAKRRKKYEKLKRKEIKKKLISQGRLKKGISYKLFTSRKHKVIKMTDQMLDYKSAIEKISPEDKKSLNLNLKLHRGLLEERSKRNKIATRERLFQMREVEDLRKIISNTRAIDKAIFIDRFVQEEDEQIVSPNITDVEQAIRKARGIYPKRYSRLKNLFETKKSEL
ncbi:unnamed protein product [Moneuplotes crassus]|uniref:Uncharacterized protein n=1 Tax=Euplotes crassus TaxID=5936 RepID=A0AAD1U8E2_EUPCR|nr:unnamed protein product [Moneuplotes crassus]